MTPAEIVSSLRVGAPSPAVWAALDALVRERVTRVVPSDQDREDAAQNVMFKFVQKTRDGTLNINGADDREVRSYLDQMARNGWRDAWRRSSRAPDLDDAAVEAASTPSTSVDDIESAQRARHAAELFHRVAEAAIERTPPAYREGRRLAWRQVEELYFEDVTVTEVVARDEGLGPTPPRDALRTAADRAMKQHQRFRDAMLETADAMAEKGGLSPDERDLVRRMVLELKRR